jgi:hypothetical protein
MNSLTRKIILVLFALMLGIYLISPKAEAVDHCIGSACAHCTLMPHSLSELIPAFGPNGQICNSSFEISPCNLNNHRELNSKLFIVSSIKQDRQKNYDSVPVADFGTFLLLNAIEKGKRDQSQIATDTIPIYLQNLSLLC